MSDEELEMIKTKYANGELFRVDDGLFYVNKYVFKCLLLDAYETILRILFFVNILLSFLLGRFIAECIISFHIGTFLLVLFILFALCLSFNIKIKTAKLYDVLGYAEIDN